MIRLQCAPAPGHSRWLAVILLVALLPGPALSGEEVARLDSRRAYTTTAPTWLRAVGRLTVPGSKYRDGHRSHYLEDCSATLVGRPGASQADTLVTAWHCLEFYGDLSRPILFTLLPGVGESGTKPPLEREAFRLADGGGMHADWAILRLYRPVPAHATTALLVHPGAPDPVRSISMAGYSRDPGLGMHGKQLTFDPDCLITRQGQDSSDSNCSAYKGASGGAVVQLMADGQPRFSGVVSEGDSASFSTFVPVAEFRRTLEQLLR